MFANERVYIINIPDLQTYNLNKLNRLYVKQERKNIDGGKSSETIGLQKFCYCLTSVKYYIACK